MLRKFLLATLTALLGATAPQLARAEFPERQIELVVPFGAGTAPDVFGRLIAERLETTLGKPVIVVNMPGAGGNLGVGHVAKAKPDGYTLVLSGDAAILVNRYLYDKLPFDPDKDLAPISQIVVTPNVLVVGKEVPATSVGELVTLAKAEPGKLTFASAGVGTSTHRAGELLAREAGIEITHVPFQKSPLPDVVGGHVTMFFANIATAMPLVRDGKLRALAVSSLDRAPIAPDVPTMQDAGYPGFEAVSWFGLFAPAGTPAEVLAHVHASLQKSFSGAEAREPLAKMGAEPVFSSPSEFTAFIGQEAPKWKDLMVKARDETN